MGVIGVRLTDALQGRLARLSERLRRPDEALITEALERFVAREERRYRETLESLAEVEAGQLIDGEEVLAWIESWGTEHELPRPRVK